MCMQLEEEEKLSELCVLLGDVFIVLWQSVCFGVQLVFFCVQGDCFVFVVVLVVVVVVGFECGIRVEGECECMVCECWEGRKCVIIWGWCGFVWFWFGNGVLWYQGWVSMGFCGFFLGLFCGLVLKGFVREGDVLVELLWREEGVQGYFGFLELGFCSVREIGEGDMVFGGSDCIMFFWDYGLGFGGSEVWFG